MEARRLLQPVLDREGQTAAHGAPGVNTMDVGPVQLPECVEESGGKGRHVVLPTIGQRLAALVKLQLLLKAHDPVAGLIKMADVVSGLLPGTGDDDHRSLRGVVQVLHARGPDHLLRVDFGGDGLVHGQLAEDGDELLRGDAAGAQEPFIYTRHFLAEGVRPERKALKGA